MGVAALFAATWLWVRHPLEDIKVQAITAGVRRAMEDADKTYGAALEGKPAYFGYVVTGDSDSERFNAALGGTRGDVLPMAQVRAVDLGKEEPMAFGPAYIYRRKDTGGQVLVMHVKLIRCSQLEAEVRVEHEGGGETVRLNRGLGQAWRASEVRPWQVLY